MSKPGAGQKSKKKKPEEKQELDIESIPINDDNWKCIVGLLIERRPRYMVHIKQINEAIQTGLRKVMKCITDDDITKDVKQLRTGKSSGSKTALTSNAHQKLCDEAYQHLSVEENIPPTILSRLIKFAILRMKANDISRKEAELTLAQEIQEESKLMMEGKSTSIGGTDGGGGSGSGSLRKSTLGRQTAYIGKEKKGTKLRKRGQEWMDIQFIDDAPRQGSDLYIVLTGFYDCELPIELIKIGIPLFGIIRLQREDEDDSDVDSLDQIETVKYKLESIMSFDRDIVSLQNEVTTKVTEIKSFWKNFRTMEFNPSFIEIFKDVAFMTLLPPPDTGVNDNIQDIEKTKEFLYRSISYLMYDLQDTIRQHAHYLKNMKVRRYISEGDWNLHRMTMYNSILRDVPHECISVPLILHAFIQEVIYFAAADGRLPMSDFIRRGSTVRSIDLRDVVKVSLEQTIEELNIIHGIKEKLPETVEYQDPLIIIHGDEVLMKTFHCEFPDFNIPEITCNILKNIIPVKLWDYFPRRDVNSHTPDETQWCFKLKHCMEDERISSKTLYNYMYVLLFDQMTCKRTEDVVALEREATMSLLSQASRTSSISSGTVSTIWTKIGTRPISNFRFFKSMYRRCTLPHYIIDDLQCLGSLRGVCTFVHKIKEKTVHGPDCYRFVEDMSVNVMLQALQVAFSTFICWEHRYCALTDTLLLRFHHPVDKDGFFEDSYSITIRTPVPLRDFFKYIVDEEWEWIAKEEDLYQKNLEEMDNNRFSPTCPDNKEDIQAIYPSRSVPMEEFLIIGSIKYEIFLKEQEEAQRQAEEAEIARRQEEAKVKKMEKRKGKDFETNQNMESAKGTKGEKKTRLEALASAGDYGFGENEQDIDSEEKEESYEFEAYDLGSTQFKISGKTTRFYSIDESKVEVNACSCLYRWKLLTLKITKSGHTLVFKTYLSAPPPNVVPVTVHIVLKSGIVIAVGKPTIERFFEYETETEASPRRVSFQSENKQFSGYDMIMSLPSGLVVETIKEPPLPFYIKQTYLSMGPQCANILGEQYRCYLQSGHVLKFMKNGNVEILSADSSMINCIGIASVAEDTIAAMRLQVRESSATFTEENPVKAVKVEEKKSDEARPKSKAKKADSKSNLPPDGMKKSGKKKIRIAENNTLADEILVEEESLTSENKTVENIPEELPALEVRDYQAITADGWQFTVKGGVSEELRKIILRTTSDLEEDEIFTRREDYTNTLLQADGSLVVSFIDGTRITTKLIISSKIVYCEWTEEEEETFQTLMEGEELEIKPMTEGYTLVTLSYLMEHQNFATVTYGQNGLLGELSIPQTNTTIDMHPNGTYEIRMSGNTELSIGNEIISFIHFDPNRSKVLCRSDVHVRGLIHDEFITDDEYEFLLLSTTRTIDGKTFEVFYSGNTQLQRNEKRSRYNFGYRIPVRWFVLQRDLSGLEIIHEDDVNSLLADIAKHHKAVTVTDKFPCDQELQYHIAMCPVDKDESQRWLADYTPVKITAKERRARSHLKRSTYGDPPSWFHPFPKTRVDYAVKEKRAQSVSSAQKDEEEEQNIFYDDEEDIPDVMVVRMIREIAPAGVSIMKVLKEGLSRFLQLDDEKFDFESLYRFGDYDTELKTIISQRKMVKHKAHWQDRTTPAAKELYLLGLRRKHKLTESEIRTIKEKDVTHIMNMAIIQSRKKRRECSLNELRTALRYHIVPPYFSSPLGEAFLLVKEALDRAVDDGENEPCEESPRTVDIGIQVDE